MKAIKYVGLLLIGVLVLVAACGSRGSELAQDTTAISESNEQAQIAMTATGLSMVMATPAPTMAAALPDTGGGGSNQPVIEEPPQQERVILRDATLTVVHEDPPAKMDSISEMTQNMGGWVVQSGTSQFIRDEETYTRANINIRIPAERLDEALGEIKSGVVSVGSETVNGRDVTSQFVDLSSRLDNLEAAEDQLQSILREAEDTQDVLTVFNELVRTRGEIESIEGQLQYFSQAAAFSLVNVTIQPEIPEAESVELAEAPIWQPNQTVQTGVDVLLSIFTFLGNVIILAVIVVLPLALLFGIPAWIIYRRRRQLRTLAE